MASCVKTKVTFVLIWTLFVNVSCILFDNSDTLPLVLTTWPYEDAVKSGWHAIFNQTKTAVDAVEAVGHYCEMNQCRMTVGFGANPDESGETTLDAMIMDGTSHNVGAVGTLRRIKQAISVARRVLDNTDHTLLVGDQATQFAVEMGFKEESLTTDYSRQMLQSWKQKQCQPNFRKGVFPDPRLSCGPYSITNTTGSSDTSTRTSHIVGRDNHDTIGIITIDRRGNVAAGTSTNGLKFKIPGRVGDSPIPGAGSYADSSIGAASCTGNGDIMMRFLPSFQAVTLMGAGMSPEQAAKQAIDSITRKYPNFDGAVVAANKQGQFGASCHNWSDFAITAVNPTLNTVTVFNITCH